MKNVKSWFLAMCECETCLYFLFDIIATNYKSVIYRSHLPTQNLLSDAECKICKYKSLIISVYSSNYGGQILCRGTEEGRKIYKNLQMKLPSKIKYTNICKDVFPVLCIFTFVNTDSCTFLYSLRSEWRATSNFCPFRYIYLCSSLYIFVIWQKMGAFYNSKLAC